MKQDTKYPNFYHIIGAIDDIIKNDIDVNKLINNQHTYCVSAKIFSKLLTYDVMPYRLRNNKKDYLKKSTFIFTILDFTQYLDQLISIEKRTNRLFIPNRKLTEYFTFNYFDFYMKVLTDIGILKRELKTVNINGKEIKYYYNWNNEKNKHAIKEIESESCSYMICEDYFLDPILILKNKSITIFKDKTPERREDEKYISKKIKNTVKDVEIDYKKAIEILFELYKDDKKTLKTMLNRLFSLSVKRSLGYYEKSNRIYNSLIGMPSEIRDIMTYNDEYFHNIDVVNCGPLILVACIKQYGLEYDEIYYDLCKKGHIYEMFYDTKIEDDKLREEARDEAKLAFVTHILYGFNEKTKINKDFAKEFPKTFNSLKIIINDLESKNKKLAAYHQNIESDVFNKIETKKSKGQYPGYDAVYFTNVNDNVDIKNQITKNFAKYGIAPTLKLTINKKASD